MLLLLTGAVYFFLKFVSPLVAPVLAAVLFVTIFGPVMKKIQSRFHVHRQLVAVFFLVLSVVLSIFAFWILATFLVGNLPRWMGGLDAWQQNVTEAAVGMCEKIGSLLGIDNLFLQERITSLITEGVDDLQEEAVSGFFSHTFQYVKILTKFGGFLIIFFIATVLLAKDYDDIINGMLEREEWHVFLEVICGIIRYVASFIKTQLVIMSTISLICSIGLTLLGVPNGFLWGILAGLLDALPFVGTGVVLLPFLCVSLSGGFWGQSIGIAFLMIVCIFIREMLEPKLIGKKIGIPPIAMLIAIYGGIHLFGIWGILKGPLGFVIIYETYHSISRR